jgi:DNA-binding response OmpR family regulator
MSDRTILLVDEPTRMRDLLTSILRMRGYAVIEIDNGRDAMRRIKNIRPDLLIIEAMLPIQSGFEICAMLRRDPEFRHLPTLMMCSSAHKPPGETVLGKDYLLSDEFLVRPFGLQELLVRIEKLIGAVPSLKSSS